jgi:hypothetical protein
MADLTETMFTLNSLSSKSRGEHVSNERGGHCRVQNAIHKLTPCRCFLNKKLKISNVKIHVATGTGLFSKLGLHYFVSLEFLYSRGNNIASVSDIGRCQDMLSTTYWK